MKKRKFVLQTHEDVLKYFLKDPEIKKAYDALEPEYQVKRALIELRIRLNETQKELADKLDTKQAYISRVERGGVSPTVNYIAKMADALNADAEIVFRPRGSKKVIRAILVKEEKTKYGAKNQGK
jgi:DNA-binding XRE family transcriptional regulator